jgi:hypothetical protein
MVGEWEGGCPKSGTPLDFLAPTRYLTHSPPDYPHIPERKMNTKYYTVEPRHSKNDWFMWLIVVEDDIIVWSQALSASGQWYTGINQGSKFSESSFSHTYYDYVEI